MMTPDARSAHERFATKLRTATRYDDRATRDLTAVTTASYAAALAAADGDREPAWRTFVAQVDALANVLERAPLRAPEIIAELRSLVHENADLLAPPIGRAVA